jgi:hypothetical protein
MASQSVVRSSSSIAFPNLGVRHHESRAHPFSQTNASFSSCVVLSYSLLEATRQELKIYMHGKLSEIRFANAATMNALS